jgi:hypothetical protein
MQSKRSVLVNLRAQGVFVGSPLADAPALASELPTSSFYCRDAVEVESDVLVGLD